MSTELTATINVGVRVDNERSYCCSKECTYYENHAGDTYCNLYGIALEGWPLSRRCVECTRAFGSPRSKNKQKFADVKVGDWIEITGAKLSHKVIKLCEDHFVAESKGLKIICYYDGMISHTYNIKVIRILKPEEVVLDFSNGIVGVIEIEWIDHEPFIHVRDKYNNYIARIWMDVLIDPMKSTVLELTRKISQKKGEE